MTRAVALSLSLVLAGALLAAPAARAARERLEDLAFDFRIVPLDREAPPFALESLEGTRVALGDFRGRPVILYFWDST